MNTTRMEGCPNPDIVYHEDGSSCPDMRGRPQDACPNYNPRDEGICPDCKGEQCGRQECPTSPCPMYRPECPNQYCPFQHPQCPDWQEGNPYSGGTGGADYGSTETPVA